VFQSGHLCPVWRGRHLKTGTPSVTNSKRIVVPTIFGIVDDHREVPNGGTSAWRLVADVAGRHWTLLDVAGCCSHFLLRVDQPQEQETVQSPTLIRICAAIVLVHAWLQSAVTLEGYPYAFVLAFYRMPSSVYCYPSAPTRQEQKHEMASRCTQ
jgi:hypothetical protein